MTYKMEYKEIRVACYAGRWQRLSHFLKVVYRLISLYQQYVYRLHFEHIRQRLDVEIIGNQGLEHVYRVTYYRLAIATKDKQAIRKICQELLET